MNFQECITRLYYEETIHELAARKTNTDNGLSYNSIMYIDAINYMENCTVSMLSERLHISKPAVTMKINELIKQGIIEKEQSTIDRRVFHLKPKARNEELFPEYNVALSNTDEYLREKYSVEELKTFEKILADAAENYIKELKKSE